MIPQQEYILLKNVEGYTVDHLINAILEGHIDAYIEWPEGKRHIPMSFQGKLSRYARIIQPVFKDGDDKLIFSKVAVLSCDGETVSTPSLCFTAPIQDILIRMGVVGKDKEATKKHTQETQVEGVRMPTPFEKKKFCKIKELSERWSCSADRIYYLISVGVLRAWHPEGKEKVQGTLIDVSSVLEAEKKNYL